MSTLGFEVFEDARCAVCDGDLDPRQTDPLGHELPELCLACQNQVVALRLEAENLKREQRRRQIEEMRAAIDRELAQADLRNVLMVGNERLREEIREIERQTRAQEAANKEARKRKEDEGKAREG